MLKYLAIYIIYSDTMPNATKDHGKGNAENNKEEGTPQNTSGPAPAAIEEQGNDHSMENDDAAAAEPLTSREALLMHAAENVDPLNEQEIEYVLAMQKTLAEDLNLVPTPPEEPKGFKLRKEFALIAAGKTAQIVAGRTKTQEGEMAESDLIAEADFNIDEFKSLADEENQLVKKQKQWDATQKILAEWENEMKKP